MFKKLVDLLAFVLFYGREKRLMRQAFERGDFRQESIHWYRMLDLTQVEYDPAVKAYYTQ